ncbi:MAG: NAD-dependent epimerase/dehydratase family protein [Alphaproteobacteria bacterium]|nr:NAD-dependent epimerase/dehydratase family protein [Alphaproteobacteria bacterium]
MKKVLILGGTGYIGTNLAIYLSEFYDITVTGRRNLNVILQKYSKIKFKSLQLSDRGELKSIVKHFDIFVLLIPNRQPNQVNKILDDDLSEIIEPTEYLFNLLSQENKKLVFASTGGAVYGDSQGKISFESDICKPINQYGKYKLRLEESLTSVQKQNQFNADILRISNPYGGHFNHYFTSGFVNTVLTKIKNKSILSIWGDGLQVRDFIHILDVCECIRRTFEIKGFNLMNIGTGIGYSLIEVFELISKVNKSTLDLFFNYDYVEKVPYNVLSTAKSKEILGYSPKLDINSGIELEKLNEV